MTSEWIKKAHIEQCRAKNCKKMGNQTVMVKASIVKKQPNARGWFCQTHADLLMGVRRGAIEARGEGVRRFSPGVTYTD